MASERGVRCADCNQILEDRFHTGVFFHITPCGAHNEWLDKVISEQAEQRSIIEKVIAPVTYDEICDYSELDEQR